MSTRKLYAYTTKSYQEHFRTGFHPRLWIKVGETIQETTDKRIDQQDGTSQPESLIKIGEWLLPNRLRDTDVHKALLEMGCPKTRHDKDREWFVCSLDNISTAINKLIYGVSRPDSYEMRDEQSECVQKATDYFLNVGKTFLIDAVPRFGKTFTTYQIVKKLDLHRVLVLTYKPSVDQAWREDLKKHVDFEGFNYICAKDFSKSKPVTLPEIGTGCDVLFASFQDIIGMTKAKWKNIQTYQFDMIVLDEQHYGTSSDLATTTLSKLKYNYKLDVSGTPMKALISGEFQPDEMFSWSYIDEQKCRQKEKENGWKSEIYRWLPSMEFYTLKVPSKVKDDIIKYYSDDEGFSMTKMFASDDGETFKDEASVQLFINQLLLGRECNKKHSPYRIKASNHSLWVLPSSVNSVNALCRLLENMGTNYKIINVAGDNVSSLNKVIDTIACNEMTITVTCGRFNTGVTVKKWDSVIMLDDGKSLETYIQTIFRVKSPDESRKKESCYVFDYNPQRCLEMLYRYAEITANPDQDTGDALREVLEFAPVLDHSGNKVVKVTAKDVMDYISKSGNYVRSFGSHTMFKWSALDNYSDIFTNLDQIEDIKIVKQLSNSDLDKGKNYHTDAKPKQGKIDLEKKEREAQKRRVMGMLAKLPEYMFIRLIDSPVKSIGDITNCNDSDRFKTVMEIDNESFADMCGPFIRADRLNRCIVSFNNYFNLT